VKNSTLMIVVAGACAALALPAPPALRAAPIVAALVAGTWAIVLTLRGRGRTPDPYPDDDAPVFDPPSFEDAIAMLAPPPSPRRSTRTGRA
jgi:hypothetical protein